MPIRAGDVITRAQIVLNDNSPPYVRWEKPEMFGWLNDAACEVVIRRPAARAVTAALALAAGTLQSLPDGGLELLDVVRNVGGRAIRRTDRQLIDDSAPDWHSMKQASAVRHFTFDERAPKTFYVYPPAKAGVQIEALYSEAPPVVTDEDDQLDLDRAYIGPLVSYILYRALAKDSEYANGALAAAHFQAFTEALGTNNQVTAAASPNVASV